MNDILKRDDRDFLCNSELYNDMPERVRDGVGQVYHKHNCSMKRLHHQLLTQKRQEQNK